MAASIRFLLRPRPPSRTSRRSRRRAAERRRPRPGRSGCCSASPSYLRLSSSTARARTLSRGVIARVVSRSAQQLGVGRQAGRRRCTRRSDVRARRRARREAVMSGDGDSSGLDSIGRVDRCSVQSVLPAIMPHPGRIVVDGRLSLFGRVEDELVGALPLGQFDRGPDRRGADQVEAGHVVVAQSGSGNRSS